MNPELRGWKAATDDPTLRELGMSDASPQAHVDALGVAPEAVPLVGSGRIRNRPLAGGKRVMNAGTRPATPKNTGFVVFHVMMTGKLACPMWGIPCPVCREFDPYRPG